MGIQWNKALDVFDPAASGEEDEAGAFEGGAPNAAATVDGIVTGTPVRTMRGWLPVETLRPGDLVLTFDDGFQPLRDIRMFSAAPELQSQAPSLWPMKVPPGAIGNSTELRLMPEQQVLIESDLAEARLGDPFVLVPALALDGWRGIHSSRPRAGLDPVVLQFDREQILYCAGGALLHAPSQVQAGSADLLEWLAAEQPRSCHLSLHDARDLVAAMRAAEPAAA